MRRLLWVVVLASACGGRVETDGGQALEPGESPLGQCVPGAEPGAAACPFYAGGLCYPSKAAACNCICPRDRDSFCASDLGGTSSTAFVECS